MANRILKSLIDEKVKAMKDDLDKLMLVDLEWIEIVCDKEKFDVVEYQRYYLEQLDEYKLITQNGNKY